MNRANHYIYHAGIHLELVVECLTMAQRVDEKHACMCNNVRIGVKKLLERLKNDEWVEFLKANSEQ